MSIVVFTSVFLVFFLAFSYRGVYFQLHSHCALPHGITSQMVKNPPLFLVRAAMAAFNFFPLFLTHSFFVSNTDSNTFICAEKSTEQRKNLQWRLLQYVKNDDNSYVLHCCVFQPCSSPWQQKQEKAKTKKVKS